MPYTKKRPRESYLGKTPEAEARRQRFLKRGDRNKTIEEVKEEAEKFKSRKKKLKNLNIIQFAENPRFGHIIQKTPGAKSHFKSLIRITSKQKRT